MGNKENTKQHGKSPDILEITIHSSEFIFPVNKQSQIGCLNMVVIDYKTTRSLRFRKMNGIK